MGKKLVNGEIIDSDEFNAVLAIDDTVNIGNWLGNIQENSLGDLYFDIAMYDWPDFLGFHIAAAITRTKFQRIYLINEEDLGTSDVAFEDLVLYPNPTNGILYISSSAQINFVQITNMLGQVVVKTPETNYDIQEIDLSELARGMYLVTLSDEYSVVTKRIIKN